MLDGRFASAKRASRRCPRSLHTPTRKESAAHFVRTGRDVVELTEHGHHVHGRRGERSSPARHGIRSSNGEMDKAVNRTMAAQAGSPNWQPRPAHGSGFGRGPPARRDVVVYGRRGTASWRGLAAGPVREVNDVEARCRYRKALILSNKRNGISIAIVSKNGARTKSDLLTVARAFWRTPSKQYGVTAGCSG